MLICHSVQLWSSVWEYIREIINFKVSFLVFLLVQQQKSHPLSHTRRTSHKVHIVHIETWAHTKDKCYKANCVQSHTHNGNKVFNGLLNLVFAVMVQSDSTCLLIPRVKVQLVSFVWRYSGSVVIQSLSGEAYVEKPQRDIPLKIFSCT